MPSLKAFLGLDGSGFQRGLETAKRQASQFGGQIGNSFRNAGNDLKGNLGGQIAAVVSLGAIQQGISSIIEYGGHVQDLSQRLGISTDAIQAWDYALKLNGSTIDSAAPFFEKLASSRAKALQGNEESINAFRKLGVSVDDLKKKRIEDIAEKLGDVFQSGDPQKLITSLREVGGRGAGDIAATLRDGLREAREEAEKLGLIIDNATIKQLDQAGDRATQFGAQLKAAFAPAVGAIVEGAQFMFYALKSFVAGIATVVVNGVDNILHPIDAAHKVMDAMKDVGQEYLDGRAALENKKDVAPLVGGDDVEEAAENVKKILSLREQLSKLIEENEMREMSKEERLLALQQKRAELLKDMAASTTEEGRLNAAIEIEKTIAQTQQLEKEKEAKAGKRGELSLNENQKIGGYVSLNSSNLQNQMLTESQRQTGLLKKLEENTRPRMTQTGVKF